MPASPVRKRNPILVQATVAPVDADGTVAFAVGTALFAAATVACFAATDWLDDRGIGWYRWVAVTGVIIGCIAYSYARWRTSRRAAVTEPAAD